MAHTTGTKTAAAIAADWRAEAASLRLTGCQSGVCQSSECELALARADQLDECARQLSTDLHTG